MAFRDLKYEDIKNTFRIEDGDLYRLNKYRKPYTFTKVEMNPNHIAGYTHIRFGRDNILAHRVVWVIHNKEDIPPGMEIDHINGDRTDNSIQNLRLVDSRANKLNQIRHRNKHVYGCHFNKTTGEWFSRVYLGDYIRMVGKYKTEKEAEIAQRIAHSVLSELIDSKFVDYVKECVEEYLLSEDVL